MVFSSHITRREVLRMAALGVAGITTGLPVRPSHAEERGHFNFVEDSNAPNDLEYEHIINIRLPIIAEEKGISSLNIEDQRNGSDEEIKTILGLNDDLGNHLGLSKDFAYRIIKHVGNYKEIFDRNLGSESTLNMERGLNNTWINGGLLYSPPFDFGSVIPVTQ